VVRYASVKIVQIDSRKDVAGPSSGMLVVGDVVRAVRDLLDGAEARDALAVMRPGMCAALSRWRGERTVVLMLGSSDTCRGKQRKIQNAGKSNDKLVIT